MIHEVPDLPETILTKYKGISCFSKSLAETSIPLIRSDNNEALAREDQLFIPLRKEEYEGAKTGRVWQLRGNPAAERLGRMLGQCAWEKHEIAETGCSEEEARERFILRYRVSYI